MILEREGGSEDYDFYVYGADGKLTTQSTFLGGTGADVPAPAPHVCMGCHYDKETRHFQPLPLSFPGH